LTGRRDDGIVVVMPGPPMTTEEYFLTPETMLPQELVWGRVRDAAAPTPGHQWVVGQFHVALKDHVEEHSIGRVWLSPIDVVLDRDSHLVVQPDLIVITAARAHIVTDRVWGPPDLVIEVLSPRPRIGTLEERIAWFAQYGVRECWLVHQDNRTVEVLQFSSAAIADRRTYLSHEQLRSSVLPTFSATPATIFGHL
jgi:Uma2 family endonuclease